MYRVAAEDAPLRHRIQTKGRGYTTKELHNGAVEGTGRSLQRDIKPNGTITGHRRNRHQWTKEKAAPVRPTKKGLYIISRPLRIFRGMSKNRERRRGTKNRQGSPELGREIDLRGRNVFRRGSTRSSEARRYKPNIRMLDEGISGTLRRLSKLALEKDSDFKREHDRFSRNIPE